MAKMLSIMKKSFLNISRIDNSRIRSSSHAAWNYRKAPPPAPSYIEKAADLITGFAWWWVLWHCYHEYPHIIGEFPYPDSRKWSDEELGIPTVEEYRTMWKIQRQSKHHGNEGEKLVQHETEITSHDN